MKNTCIILLAVMCLANAAAADGVPDKITKKVTAFPLSQVRLLDSPFKKAQEKDAAYLLSVDADRLLAKFRTNAGLEPKKPHYGGWEAQTIAGHSLGHYLSAVSLMYAATGDARLKDRSDYIVSELAECQKAGGDGLVTAIPNGRKVFGDVAAGNIRIDSFGLNGMWVPWYAQHKVYAGLLDAHKHCENAQALEVVKALGDWGIDTTKNLTEAQFQHMLDCEFGGMNESYFELYSRTGDEKYLAMAQRFFHKKLLAPFFEGRDALPGKHGNTQFPKVIGHAREYELTGASDMRDMVAFFWDCVANHHTYVTGGNTMGEHFGQRDKLNDRLRRDCTETCNTYNMLKMTRHLYEWTGDTKYYDYYERGLFNHILASIDVSDNPDSLFTYFVPLESGGFRTYSSAERDWTCCHGTGMENHAKYGEAIYYHAVEDGKDVVYVNLLIPSVLDWKGKGVKITVTPGGRYYMPAIRVEADEDADFVLKVRVPRNMDSREENQGYLTVGECWEAGKVAESKLPLFPRRVMEHMPDNENRVAFFAGPWLLAGKLGSKDKPLARIHEIASDDKNIQSVVVSETRDPAKMLQPMFAEEACMCGCSTRMELAPPASTKLAALLPRPEGVEMVPFYQATERYAVYFDIFTEKQWQAEQEKYLAAVEARKRMEARTVDFFQPGEMQPERDHDFTGEKSFHGEAFGGKWRDARDGGFMEFTMKADADTPCSLSLTYWGGDGGHRVFDVLFDGEKVGTQRLESKHPDRFFDVTYPIPAGKNSVRVRLQAHDGAMAGGFFGCRVLRDETAAALRKSVKTDGGILFPNISYVTGGGERQQLDLYLPEGYAEAEKPLPVILLVHGGAWEFGSKQDVKWLQNWFTPKGFAVAAINYRLIPKHPLPAAIIDCKSAVRWLRANAKEFHLDTERFGAWGHSAGGHLVSLLGTLEGTEFDEGENLDQTSSVQAVCDVCGPADFIILLDDATRTGLFKKLFGESFSEKREFMAKMSPTKQATKNAAPFLILQAEDDPLVPPGQSRGLDKALREAGAESELHVFPAGEGGHGCRRFFNEEGRKRTVEFFEKHLKKQDS